MYNSRAPPPPPPGPFLATQYDKDPGGAGFEASGACTHWGGGTFYWADQWVCLTVNLKSIVYHFWSKRAQFLAEFSTFSGSAKKHIVVEKRANFNNA